MIKDEAIILSLLDQDKYKFTMGYVFFKHFTDVLARYKFKNRSKINLLPYKDQIIDQLKHLCTLKFTQKELDFVHGRNDYFSKGYIDFLRNLQLNYDYLDIREENGELYIGTFPDTPLIYTTWFELFVLPITQEIYTKNTYPNINYSIGKKLLDEKISAVYQLACLDWRPVCHCADAISTDQPTCWHCR